MATKPSSGIPAGMHTVTTQIFFNQQCKQAIEFYQLAFGASVVGNVVPTPDGEGVWHAMLQIGDSMLMVNDSEPDSYERGPSNYTTQAIWLYVDDCDIWFERAVKAGAQVIMPLTDMFWGDRMGKLRDPFGHTWDIATHTWDYTPEEMEQKQQEMIQGLE